MKLNNKFAKFGQTLKANKKKIIVVCSMVALLVATGCLNYFLNAKTDQSTPVGDTNEPQATTTFFAT